MKLPQIVAREEVPGRIPGGEVSPGAFAAPALALAEGAQQLGAATARTSVLYAHAATLLQQAKAKAELETTTEQLKTRFADADIQLRSQGTDPDQYPQAVADSLKGIATDLGDGLTTPEAKAAWQGTVAKFAAEKVVHAKYDALRMKQGQVKLLWASQQEEDANQAVFAATPDERQAAFARGLDRSGEGLRTGIFSADEAAADRKGFLARVEKGGIERDYRNPELRGGVISTLLNGGYRHLDAAWQIEKARTLQEQSDKDDRAIREAIKDWWKEQQSGQVRDWFQQAANKTLDLAAFEQDAKDWRLSRQDYDAIRTEALKPAQEKASDPTTLQAVMLDTHSQYPRYTEGKIKALLQSGDLNLKDAQGALDRLRETREGLQNKAESQRMQAYHDGLADLQARLGVPTQWERLDPIQKKAWSLAQQEYRRRAFPFDQAGQPKPGAENARAVVENLAPIYLGTMGADARMDKELLLGRAKASGYETAEQVSKDFAAKKISREIRDNLINIFNEIKAKEDLERQSLDAMGGRTPTDRAKSLKRE